MYELDIYEKSGEYYAENPNVTYMDKPLGKWVVKLDSNKIKACAKFIDAVMSPVKDCKDWSSSVEHYNVIINGDTIKLYNNLCNSDSINYFILNELVFKEKFDSVKHEQEILAKQINQKLKGTWYFKPLTKKLKRNEQFVLTRTNSYKSKCYWVIADSLSFKNNCNSILNLTYSTTYELNIRDVTYFEIQSGFKIDNDGNRTVTNYGATFILNKVDANYLIITYLWE
ncbi:MAG TPA: hypothetical protein VK167_03070 [Flavipsychrobacter sp.]|nr:hypothetical protein [Flavipsychrobacter sp.]